MKTKPDLTKLISRQCPKSNLDLKDAIIVSGSCDHNLTFGRLDEALSLTPNLLSVTLPFVWNEALMASETLPEIKLQDEAGSIILTQRQCLCILANAFFCTYTERRSDNCLSGPNLPSINFDELYGSDVWGPVEVAKLRMLFTYFEQMRQRDAKGDKLSRPITFIRREAKNSTVDDWIQCRAPLKQPVMHELRESIDDAKEMLRVDFANCLIGGAAISYGCVQEEIMFCECPELIVCRLFFPAMKPNEAIAVIGAEQFSKHTGYAANLGYGGTYVDPSPTLKNGILGSYIVAIDAFDFRLSDDWKQQYRDTLILRELTKAWAGFSIIEVETPENLATGNWGCGAFEGNPQLKSVLQWLASCRAEKTMNYFPFDNRLVSRQFPVVVDALISRGFTVGGVSRFLMQEMQPFLTYRQLLDYGAE